jgi:hypothetical protein
MAVVQQKEQVKELIPEKGSLDVMEPEIRSIQSKVQEGSVVQDESATESNKEENEFVKLEEPIVTRDPTAVEPVVQEKENEISAELEKQQVPAIVAEAIVQEEDKENNTSVDLEKQEIPAIAVESTVQEDIEEHQVSTEHEAVKSEEPVVSREIPIAVEETPETTISEDKNEVPETEQVSTEQEPAELEEPPIVSETHIAVVEPIIQDEEKEDKTIVESEKQEVSSEEPIVSREIHIIAKKMAQEEEAEIVTESKEQEVSTKQEQEPVELEEPIVSREIHVEEEKEPETTIESEKKAPSPFLAEFHATEAAALLAGQTYSLENASVNSTQQVVKTDEKADMSQDMPKENTSQDEVKGKKRKRRL